MMFLFLQKKRRRVWSECEECGRRFSRMSLLKAHRQTHAGNATADTPSPSSPPAHTTTQLRCSECGKRFYSAMRLQSHIQTQHPGKRSWTRIEPDRSPGHRPRKAEHKPYQRRIHRIETESEPKILSPSDFHWSWIWAVHRLAFVRGRDINTTPWNSFGNKPKNIKFVLFQRTNIFLFDFLFFHCDYFMFSGALKLF